MPVHIHPISLGIVSAFLLKREKNVLIDAGVPGQMARFLDELALTNTQPDEIDLLLLTHGHSDHIGLTKEIVDLSGAQTAIHYLEKAWVETGKPPFPPGATAWGKILASMFRFFPDMNIPASKVDFTLGDENLSLEAYGIPGQVVHKPQSNWER